MADDSADARSVLETFLSYIGCKVCAVADGYAVTADVSRAEGAIECFDRVLTKPLDLDCLGKLVLREGAARH